MIDDRSKSKNQLIRELKAARARIETLEGLKFRPLTKKAAIYLRVLSTAPHIWVSPNGLHLAAMDDPGYVITQSASGSAITSLETRGYIERKGSLLRITAAGLADARPPDAVAS